MVSKFMVKQDVFDVAINNGTIKNVKRLEEETELCTYYKCEHGNSTIIIGVYKKSFFRN